MSSPRDADEAHTRGHVGQCRPLSSHLASQGSPPPPAAQGSVQGTPPPEGVPFHGTHCGDLLALLHLKLGVFEEAQPTDFLGGKRLKWVVSKM